MSENSFKGIDSHQHFWVYSKTEYSWMDAAPLAPLRQDRLPQDLKTLQKGTSFDGSVAVQARQTIEESKWLLELADEAPDLIKGVVGWVDLRSKNVADQIAQFVPHSKFKGVRHVVQDEPDVDFMLGKEFQNGISELEKFGLTYDILIFPKQLPAAISLVGKFPNQSFVLDHIAKPNIKDGEGDQWKSLIKKLSHYKNVSCKISGMITEADWTGWKLKDLTPYMDWIVECFSTKRIMFGSDWPVCTLAGSYQKVAHTFDDYFADFSESEQKDIYLNNTTSFYSLDK